MAAIAIKTYLIWPFTIFYVSKCLELNVWEYMKNIYKPIFGGVIMFAVFKLIADYIPVGNPLVFIFIEMIACAVTYSLVMVVIAKKDIMAMMKLVKN